MKCMKTFLFAALTIFIGATEAVNDLLPRTTPGSSVPVTTRATDIGPDSILTLSTAMSTNKTTSASWPATSAAASPPQPPYATGSCSFHLTQWYLSAFEDPPANNGNDAGVYDCEILILDANRTTIGRQTKTRCSSTDSLRVMSKLESPMVITPEDQNDYIQFTLGTQSWPSSQQGPNFPHCRVGGWDGSDDPAYRQMDCSFTCTWGGGHCSNGLC